MPCYKARPDPEARRLTHSAMTEVTGIDHIYIAVSDLARSEIFYDRVLLDTLGFHKNKTPIY